MAYAAVSLARQIFASFDKHTALLIGARGRVGTGCTMAGQEVRQGDLVVADSDAVVVFDPADVPDIVEKGRARLDKEAEIMERVRAGETTCEIFGLT